MISLSLTGTRGRCRCRRECKFTYKKIEERDSGIRAKQEAAHWGTRVIKSECSINRCDEFIVVVHESR